MDITQKGKIRSCFSQFMVFGSSLIHEKQLIVLIAMPVLRTGTTAGSGQVCSFEMRNSQIGIISLFPQLNQPHAVLCWAGFGFAGEKAFVPVGQKQMYLRCLRRWAGACSPSHFVKLGQVLHSGSVRRPGIIGKNQEQYPSDNDKCAKLEREEKGRNLGVNGVSVGLSQESVNHPRGSRVTTKKYLWRSVVQRLIIQT